MRSARTLGEPIKEFPEKCLMEFLKKFLVNFKLIIEEFLKWVSGEIPGRILQENSKEKKLGFFFRKTLTVISGGIPVETTDEISVTISEWVYVRNSGKKFSTYLRTTSYRDFCKNLWHIFWKNNGINPVEVLERKL